MLPLLRTQRLRVFIQPANVAVALFPPAIGGERGDLLAKVDQRCGEMGQSTVRLTPVEPGQGIVLAIGVIVAVLTVALLIARQQHRRALR